MSGMSGNGAASSSSTASTTRTNPFSFSWKYRDDDGKYKLYWFDNFNDGNSVDIGYIALEIIERAFINHQPMVTLKSSNPNEGREFIIVFIMIIHYNQYFMKLMETRNKKCNT